MNAPSWLGAAGVSIDVASLTHAHVALVQVERELREQGRTEAARGLAVADLVVLGLRRFLSER